MSKYDETMELIRQKTASRLCEIPFTEDEVGALSIYMEAYLPEKWLRNIMSAWKKIDDADKGIAEQNKANKPVNSVGEEPVSFF